MTYTCNIDTETRATVDLAAVGSYVYARHKDTRLLCAAYSFDRGKTIRYWRTWEGEDLPADLHKALLDDDCIFEAWNASFERLIFKYVEQFEVPIERWHCTMARARSMALPGKLELCARALHVPEQKMDNSIMMKWCKPLKNGGWADDPTEYSELVEYCGGDVLAEAAIGAVVRPLTDGEWLDYRINEEINDRGVPVDLALAAAAQNYAADELDDIRDRLAILTKGEITSPKQFQRIKAWLERNLPDDLQLQPDDNGKISFDAAAREELLSDENAHFITGDLREFIELVHDGGRASTSKFAAMLARGVNEQRVYGAYVFNGAGQTGRFSSQGLQTHNFVRDKLENIEAVVEAILRKVPHEQLIDIASYRPDGTFVFDRDEQLTKPYNVLTILSRTLRPSIVADAGKVLVWGDWKSIEAVTLPWLSKENSASELLDYFASGKDIYVRQAMLTYNLTAIEQVTKQQRQAGGKIPILSFGFGGGAGAIMRMARAYGVEIDEKTAEELKVAWRESNPWAGRFWKALELAAFQAVRRPQEVFWAGRVAYMFTDNVLWCLLPCGRMLAYPFARISTREKWGEERLVVTAMKGSFHPKKGTSYWPRMELWGGFQAENVTQGGAASVLRHARRELYNNLWPQIGDTHDELLLEVNEDEEDEAKAVLKNIMTSGFDWTAGLPLLADIDSGYVYGK